MTDGKIDPVSERSKAFPTAQRLLNEGIDIYAVGIEPTRISAEDLKRMQEDLVNITGRKQERVFETDDFNKLKKQVLDSVLNAVNCNWNRWNDMLTSKHRNLKSLEAGAMCM